MNARLMAASAVGGFALAAFLFSGQYSGHSSGQLLAQPGGSKHVNGIFGALKVGQMVQFDTDGWGIVIKTFDDEEFSGLMRHKVMELGDDYIVIEFDDKNGTGSIVETRLPVYRFSQVIHVGKSDPSKKPGAVAPTALDDKTPGNTGKKPAGTDKKPGMPKKKP